MLVLVCHGGRRTAVPFRCLEAARAGDTKCARTAYHSWISCGRHGWARFLARDSLAIGTPLGRTSRGMPDASQDQVSGVTRLVDRSCEREESYGPRAIGEICATAMRPGDGRKPHDCGVHRLPGWLVLLASRSQLCSLACSHGARRTMLEDY